MKEVLARRLLRRLLRHGGVGSVLFYSSAKMHEQSSFALSKELQRKIRDKSLQAIIDSDKEKNDQSGAPSFHNDDCHGGSSPSMTSFGSVFIDKYFKENLCKFQEQYGDVIAKINLAKSDENADLATKKSKTKLRKEHTPVYPYDKVTSVGRVKIDGSTKSDLGSNPKSIDRSKIVTPDRGFHYVGDSFQDDFISGSALDLPQEKQFSLLKSKISNERLGKQPKTFSKRMGPKDAVEEIDFQLPHQPAMHGTHVESDYKEDWHLRYGAEDPNVPLAPAGKDCPACGARFHCQNTGLPGFLPVEYFQECLENDFKPKKNTTQGESIICRRCYLLKNYNFLLNVNVSQPNYKLMLSDLKSKHHALVILIVDLLDFPCSIYKNLPDLIGVGKHVIIVGNKVDLIPPDSGPDYLKHYRNCLRKAVLDYGFDNQFKIDSIQLISAKTGFGIEDLISRIYQQWQYRGDIYLVGCTNSGKSTLFNALLQSDLCKVRAVDLVERATASIWPGTTLNLLKFPVMNPTSVKMLQRDQRLKYLNKLVEKEEQHRRLIYEEMGDKNYAVLQGHVGQTFANPEGISKAALQKMEEAEGRGVGLHFMPNPHTSAKTEKLDLKRCPEFATGNWCFDTPGTVNEGQIINILTLEELVKTVPGSLLHPRPVTLRKNQTVLVGGLIRIDLFETNKPNSAVILTFFCSEKLPLFVLERWEVPKFYSKYIGTKVLEVPYGNSERLADFPQLFHKTVEIDGCGPDNFCADVVLSSVGWAAIKTGAHIKATLNIWTPNGVGVHVRRPPLIRSLPEK